MKIVEKVEEVELCLGNYETYYIRELNLAFIPKKYSLKIINLDNAMKTGKKCTSYTYCSNSNFWIGFTSAILSKYTLRDFLEEYKEQKIETMLANVDITLHERELPSKNVYSPFFEPTRDIKSVARWTIPTVVKLLILNKGKVFRKALYTDDYKRDSETNFGKGILDQANFVKKLVEEPSGWRILTPRKEGEKLIVDMACHHFDYIKITFTGVEDLS